VFELYDLQKASKFEKVGQNIIFTASVTVLFFILTPFYTPSLPENRLQILFFFLAIVGALLLWRFAYITIISAPRFYKKVLLIGNASELGLMVKALQKSDPNYAIVGYINTSKDEVISLGNKLIQFVPRHLSSTIREEGITEIVVASTNNNTKDGVDLTLLKQLNIKQA